MCFSSKIQLREALWNPDQPYETVLQLFSTPTDNVGSTQVSSRIFAICLFRIVSVYVPGSRINHQLMLTRDECEWVKKNEFPLGFWVMFVVRRRAIKSRGISGEKSWTRSWDMRYEIVASAQYWVCSLLMCQHLWRTFRKGRSIRGNIDLSVPANKK